MEFILLLSKLEINKETYFQEFNLEILDLKWAFIVKIMAI